MGGTGTEVDTGAEGGTGTGMGTATSAGDLETSTWVGIQLQKGVCAV